jgi:hypothetical protein
VHNAYLMCPSKECFAFAHPTAARSPADIAAIDNSRMARLAFDVPLGGELHGFIGYFHSTLYSDGVETVRTTTKPNNAVGKPAIGHDNEKTLLRNAQNKAHPPRPGGKQPVPSKTKHPAWLEQGAAFMGTTPLPAHAAPTFPLFPL